MTLIITVLSFLAVIVSLSVHEFMHAFVAHRMGDQTAERAGRLTLNPLSHIDLFGTILVPLLLSYSGLPGFGWAKPVPYNPYNLSDQKYGPVWVALAGPFANLVLFFLSAAAFRLSVDALPPTNLFLLFLFLLAQVNVSLAIFNILPVPPLDGAKLLMLFSFRGQQARWLAFLEQNGQWLLILYLAWGAPGLSFLITTLLRLVGLV